MAELFAVPEVAAGTTEVVVAEWLVEPGAAFRAGDPIAVIETDKAVVEVEAETDATLLRALVDAGRAAEVGTPMALVGSAEEVGGDLDALLAGLGVAGQDGGHDAAARRDVPDEARDSRTASGATPAADAASATSSDESAATSPSTSGGRIFISPIARKLLRDAGLSAEQVRGSGPNGRIRRRDVEPLIAEAAQRSTAATASAAPVPIAPTSPTRPEPAREAPAAQGAGWVEEPHSRLRRAVARRLTESKQQVPHFYVRRTAVLDDLLELRRRVNEASPTRISVNDFIIAAVARAHAAVPEANVVWTEDGMRRFEQVDVAVAIDSERGLVTPVLRDVRAGSLSAISAQVRSFATRADDGRLQQSDLEGGSITVSNLGMFGVEEFSAIINPPQSSILAVGAARRVPAVEGEEVVVRTAVELVLSVDHRAIDGALAARWMGALVDALHEPLGLLV